MARDTLLGFPAHTLPYRRGKFITLSTASAAHGVCRFLTVKGPGLSGNMPDGSAGELSFSEFERGM